MAKTKTHRYKVTLDLDDPEELALSELLDALKPRNNGRTSFQRRALLSYMASLVQMDLHSMENLEEAQLAIQAQMILKGRGVKQPGPAMLNNASIGGAQQIPSPALGASTPAPPSSSAAEESASDQATRGNASEPEAPLEAPRAPSPSAPEDAPHQDQARTQIPQPKPASPLKGALAGIM